MDFKMGKKKLLNGKKIRISERKKKRKEKYFMMKNNK